MHARVIIIKNYIEKNKKINFLIIPKKKIKEFGSGSSNMYQFMVSLEIGFLGLILISFLSKRSMPLTRKLLDMAQTLGLFYYFDFGYSSEAEMLMKIL